MPQYLAPGVYVEEIQGPEVIQAAGTQTAGFIGPARFGPTSGRPELLTSFMDYQRLFGDWVDLEFVDTGDSPNYMALGVKGFFDEGGTECYVCRTFNFSPAAVGRPLARLRPGRGGAAFVAQFVPADAAALPRADGPDAGHVDLARRP